METSGDLLIEALDVFPTEAALLASDGTILYTNQRWHEFGRENGLVGTEAATLDENYLTVTGAADDEYAREAAAGLTAVLSGKQSRFRLEYPCHSPTEKRWFLMVVQGFDYQDDRYAVMVHLNITDRKLAELAVGEQNEALEGLHRAVHDLLQTDSKQEVADRTVTYLDELLEFPIVGFWLYDADRGALIPAAESEDSDALIEELPIYSGGESLSWQVFSTNTTRVIDDLTDVQGRYNPDTPIQSEIIIPLGDYGVINIGATEPNAFDTVDVTLAEIWTGTVTQVLARLDREEQLRDQRRELTRERDRLEDFASLVSHDLRNPLNVATGRLELAQDEYESENLDAVENSLDRMDRLIDDLLTLARQGQAVGSRDAVHLPSLVKKCWTTVETTHADLVVTTERTVVADEGRLQQVFENLFRNAIEHGGEDVTITVGDLSDDRGFFVEDDGNGIPEAKREDIFAAGYSTAADGTGFGLSIVQDIVEAHGWEIQVTEGNEGGARFEITDIETVA